MRASVFVRFFFNCVCLVIQSSSILDTTHEIGASGGKERERERGKEETEREKKKKKFTSWQKSCTFDQDT